MSQGCMIDVGFSVNGRKEELQVAARTTLAEMLREQLDLRGTHLGCEHGVCGACTVVLDGSAVRSCLVLAAQVDGAVIRTVEGLSDPDLRAEESAALHPLQQSFWDRQALQCGFCTPGFLMTALTAVQEDPDMDREGLRARLAGNICRCTGYQSIINAVIDYAESQARS